MTQLHPLSSIEASSSIGRKFSICHFSFVIDRLRFVSVRVISWIVHKTSRKKTIHEATLITTKEINGNEMTK
jgi:hypothetical protein